ncbi:MAG: hypothetical protein V2B18_21205 [Pseudomonadota bacterium]
MLDAPKVKQRIADLAASFRAWVDLTGKDKAKLTKTDRSKITALEDDLSAILEPEHRSDFVTDVNGIARFFGVTARSVQLWTAKGCPKLKHGRYDLKFVHEWWIENIASTGKDTEEIIELRKEHLRWKIAIDRMKAEQTRGELIPLEEISPAWCARMAAVSSGLDQLEYRLPPLLEGLSQNDMRPKIVELVWKMKNAFCQTGKFTPAKDGNGTKK